MGFQDFSLISQSPVKVGFALTLIAQETTLLPDKASKLIDPKIVNNFFISRSFK